MLRVGITADWQYLDGNLKMVLDRAYHEWLRGVGLVPIALPALPRTEADAVRGLHGIVLSGGRDIHPCLYGGDPEPRFEETYSHQDRSAFEFALVWRSTKLNIPLLGICLGCQTINVALGGDLVRHMVDPKHRHRRKRDGASDPRHRLRVEPGSIIGGLYDSRDIRVHSSHHQSVGLLARGLKATAWGPDGVVEAIENPERPRLLGIQWHPEVAPRSRFSRAIALWLKAKAEEHRAESV